MLDQLQHERKWSERLLREVYKDFLSEDEITAVLNNKDIWMDGQEVSERLKARQAKIEAEEAAAEEKEDFTEVKLDAKEVKKVVRKKPQKESLETKD